MCREGIVTVTDLAVRLETSETGGVKPTPDPHYRHRFPAEIISHAKPGVVLRRPVGSNGAFTEVTPLSLREEDEWRLIICRSATKAAY
jgi:hypothetical protein